MQTPLTNNRTQTSLAGNSRSLETQTDSPSTHHRNHLRHHLPDDPREEEAMEVVEAVEAEEDYPRLQDQVYSLHTDKLLTQSF
jgi:hypothetical protein